MSSNNRFVQSHLRRLPLFARLDEEQLNAVAGIVQVARVEPGTLLVQQGQPAQALFLFVSGRALLTRMAPDGVEEQVGSIGVGQYIGQETLYMERIEPQSLRVVESAVVLVVPKQSLAALIVQSPALRANIGMQPPELRRTVRIFNGQREGETVHHVFKRHWWAFGRQLWFPLLIATALLVGAGLLAQTAALALVLLGAAVIVPGGIALFMYADWQDDCLIITDQRVVRIEDVLLAFQKTINEVPLERAYEINADIPATDPFARIFNYGTLIIKAGGGGSTIKMDILANPQRILRTIFAERDRFREDAARRSREAIHRDLDQALGLGTAAIDAAPAAASVVTERGFSPLRTRWIDRDGTITYRRHFTLWLRHVFLSLLIMLGGLGVGIAALLLPSLQALGLIALLVAGGLFLFGLVLFYLADWDWRHDLLIVGRETITIIHKRPLWLQNETEQIRLSQVDNVISEVNGILDNLLNRGNLRISLVGGDIQDAKRFVGVGDPQAVQGEISRRLADINSNQANAAIPREAIAEYLAAYHQKITGQPQAASPQDQVYSPPNIHVPPADVPPPQVRDGSRPPGIPRMRGD
jgi:hypothetical protein